MRYLISIILATTLVACTVTSRLHRNDANANLSHLNKTEQEIIRDTTISRLISSKIESKRYHIYRGEVINGEYMGIINLGRVVVTSKLRIIPERGGEITLDFVVTIPKGILSQTRIINITPQLHDEKGTKPLENINIRGVLIDKIQRRDQWQYETYLSRFSPTEEEAQRMYNRLVRFPQPKNSRLDSLFENSSHITYYYSQKVKTDETTKRIKITLDGTVEGADKSMYIMPPSDTICFSISSMLSFVDLTPRFKTRVVDKYVTVNDRNFIQYPLEKSNIVESLGNNEAELSRITALMHEITEQDEFYVDAITLTATSSPEGKFEVNNKLSEQRAKSLRNYLSGKFGEEVKSIMSVKWVAEDWATLREMIQRDSQIVNKAEIIKIIDTEKDQDNREYKIRGRYTQDYIYIRENLYPELRCVNFKYNLRRKGMIKDTIHTTELDTLYARGVKLLQQRQYPKAAYILNNYNDRNTIIAHMSMGHDKQALQLLEMQPKDATTCYLMAIVLSRLGEISPAIEAYKEACELDPRMEFRANLDPEITKLLKR